MSEKYEAPNAEIVKFNSMDVICTSGCDEPTYPRPEPGDGWTYCPEGTYYYNL